MVAILEPRISGDKADRVISKIGFSNSYRVETRGFSGGIWLLWDDSLSVDIVATHPQFIHALVNGGFFRNSFFVTAVYGSPHRTNHMSLWTDPRNYPMPVVPISLVVLGEGKGVLNSQSQGFINQHNLLDLGFKGPHFTWYRGGVSERLDRMLANDACNRSFPSSTVHHVLRIKSDQGLFYFSLKTGTYGDINASISRLTDSLKIWNCKVYGHVIQKKRNLKLQLDNIQANIDRYGSHHLFDKDPEIRTALEKTLKHEELLWKQKSGSTWLVEGERNTKYFHSKTLNQRKDYQEEPRSDERFLILELFPSFLRMT
ncbi:uncharacterized protein LOC120139409 [Hibiscus syriacus]|uniref:uncharacterized protein LOC120139409 n=1 Tax=Hibiscus syriacus TaxID=106335 RepID=UPI00192348E4|nr:uncharacterized protein LOC120139409 [Hibiscus syriacus]